MQKLHHLKQAHNCSFKSFPYRIGHRCSAISFSLFDGHISLQAHRNLRQMHYWVLQICIYCSFSQMHTSVFTPVGVRGSIFVGENINRLEGVHCCMARSVDSAGGLTSAWTECPSPKDMLVLRTCTPDGSSGGVDLWDAVATSTLAEDNSV